MSALNATIALIRIGVRDARRNKARSVLVAAMIGVPVLASSAAEIWDQSTHPSANHLALQFNGRADVALQGGDIVWPGNGYPTPENLSIERAEAISGGIMFLKTGHGRDVRAVTVASGPRSSQLLPPMPLDRGAEPTKPDQIALSTKVADELHVGIGDWLDVVAPRFRVQIVGLHSSSPLSGWGEFEVLGRGLTVGAQLASRDDVLRVERTIRPGRTFVRLAVDERRIPEGVPSFGRSPTSKRSIGLVLIISLIWTGLIAASALSIGVRRRRNLLANVAAAGASPFQLQMLAILEAIICGTFGASVAVAFAVCGWLAVARLQLVSWNTRPIDVPWVFLAATWCAGVLAAVCAGLIATRRLADFKVRYTLARRERGDDGGRRWIALTMALALASVCLWAAIPGEFHDFRILKPLNRWRTVGVWTASFLWLGSMLSAVVVAISKPSLAGLGSGVVGLVARDLRRGGAKITSVVAALTLTCGLGAMLTIPLARVDTHYVPREDLEPRWVYPGSPRHLVEVGNTVEVAPPDRAALKLLETRGARRVDLWKPVDRLVAICSPPHACDGLMSHAIILDAQEIGGSFGHADVETLMSGGMLVPNRGTLSTVSLNAHAVRVASAADSQIPINFPIVAKQTLIDVGVELRPAVPYWLLPRRNVSDLKDLANEMQSRRIQVVPRSFGGDGSRLFYFTATWPYGKMSAFMTIVVTVLTLLVLAIALSLHRVEQATEDNVLVAIGAGPRTLRFISGLRAAWMAGVAATIGCAYGAAAALWLRNTSNALSLAVLWQLPVAVVCIVVTTFVVFAAFARTNPTRPRSVT